MASEPKYGNLPFKEAIAFFRAKAQHSNRTLE